MTVAYTKAKEKIMNTLEYMDYFWNGSKREHFEVEETDKAWILSITVPGCEKEGVSARVANGILKVSAKSKRGVFERSWSLPEGTVDEDKIAGTLKNGILVLEIPKSERAKGREIKIE